MNFPKTQIYVLKAFCRLRTSSLLLNLPQIILLVWKIFSLMCHTQAITEHITKCCKHKTLVLPFDFITKEMNHPKYSVLGSSQSPQVLFRNMGSSHWHVSLTINISVGSISSFELRFICCALLRIDLWSTSVSIASTTHQVFYLWCPVVSVTVLRL